MPTDSFAGRRRAGHGAASRPGLRIAVWVAAFLFTGGAAVGLQRQANTTLKLPTEPPATFGYALEVAFPNVAFAASPAVLATPPGESRRLFAADLSGRIHVIRDVLAPTQETFLDLSAKVNRIGEGGLLGFAFHPRFAENGYFYVYYTGHLSLPGKTGGFENRVSRFKVSDANPNVADPGSEVILIRQHDPDIFHNAGCLEFGPDGYLYVSFGEVAGGQDTRTLDQGMFGGIVRIDVDERPENLLPNPYPGAEIGHYRVPADNPFIGVTQYLGRPVNPERLRTEFWALGLRNTFRFAFDPETGCLFGGDVGWYSRDEVNLIAPGQFYGWRAYEGTLPLAPGLVPTGASLRWPLHEYGGDGLRACIIGGFVYRGSQFPELNGAYLFCDLFRGWIRALKLDDTGGVEIINLIEGNRGPITLGRNPATGEVLVVVSGTGRIFRLTRPAAGHPANRLPGLLSQTGAFKDLAALEPEAGIVPYNVALPFWSDQALKRRWFSVPTVAAKITWKAAEPWVFPTGTVFIKHFDLETRPDDPASRRRLETRFLVKGTHQVWGATYRWLPDQSDARLADVMGEEEDIIIEEATGPRVQRWRYPSRAECVWCHSPAAGGFLGFNSEQLNCPAPGVEPPRNQIERFHAAGYFSTPPPPPADLPRLYAPADERVSTEVRARSYLSANCSYCHVGINTGAAGRGWMQAALRHPLASTHMLWGDLADRLGSLDNKVLVPGDEARSIAYQRVAHLGRYHMPPIATSVLNDDGIQLLREWILGTAFVVGRHVFYNHSAFDGQTAAAGPADDGAIAPDKTALLPDGTASFANYTSYSRGLNGIMVDIHGLREPPGPEDFVFTAGNSADPSTWLPAPAPVSVTTRRGAGVRGSDRVTLIWADGAIVGAWLKIKVKATRATGLGYPDEFYFGNAPGETGNDPANARVDTADLLRVRANPRSLLNPAPLDSPHDMNRDRRVDAADQLIVRANATTSVSALKLLRFPYDGWKASRLESESLP